MAQGLLADIPPRPGALNTAARVREELSRVYRDMRTGRIPMDHGTKLTYVLWTMIRVIEMEELEVRIEHLEAS